MYMKLHCHHPQRIAAAKAGFSERTGRRIEGDPRLPSQKSAEQPNGKRLGLACWCRNRPFPWEFLADFQ
jgi:hypothetical protein